MKKIYHSLLLLFCILSYQANTQVNYIFSVSNNNYEPLTNGIRANLEKLSPIGYYEEDEGFENNVPIGFNFIFNYQTYTHLNINVNGFVTFGKGFEVAVGDKYNKNNLTSGPTQDSTRPVIAPLWDDLWILNKQNLTYKTIGTAPNRKFIIQWDSVAWNYNIPVATISFQLILHETSNLIQFKYLPLGGNVTNGSASIGIATCSKCMGSFLSVSGFDNAEVNGIKEFTEINKKPTAGITFSFEPGKLKMPIGLRVDEFKVGTVVFSWNSEELSNYDYAINTSYNHPSQYSSTSTKKVTVDRLLSAAQYYIHVRNRKNSELSSWLTIPYTSPSITKLPYKQDFEESNLPSMPQGITQGIISGYHTWQTVNINNQFPNRKVIALSGTVNDVSEAWFMLPCTQFEQRTKYTLRLRFFVTDNSSGSQEFEIVSGLSYNNNWSGWTTLFSYKNIREEKQFKDTSITISFPETNNYFIAIRGKSVNSLSAIVIDDIEIGKPVTMPIQLAYFSVKAAENDNIIQWQTLTETDVLNYEIQKSADGINFSSIDSLTTKSLDGNSSRPLNYEAYDEWPNITGYYRLKINTNSRHTFYSTIVKVARKTNNVVVLSKVYPNPATNYIKYVVESKVSSKSFITCTDLTGKIVFVKTLQLKEGNNTFSEDISSYSSGNYLLQITLAGGIKSNTDRFVKF